MFERAELGHIERLHGIGRQLAVLKRIYQSYDRIITRILDHQMALKYSTTGALATGEKSVGMQPSAPFSAVTASGPALGVALPAAAIVRFERLKDSINLYAVSEIQACLDEKESLVFLVSPALFAAHSRVNFPC